MNYINSTLNAVNPHGTNVAGIIGACRNNKNAAGNWVGIAGIAGGDYSGGGGNGLFNGALLYMMRVGDVTPSLDAISAAIYYGTINGNPVPTGIGWGQDIMNFSVGGGDYNSYLRIAISEAYKHKIILLCARGNNGTIDPTAPVYPASLNSIFDDWVVCVGGTDEFGFKDGIASSGDVDVSAPSVPTMITTTGLANTYPNFDGTSAATAHLSGIAALMLSYFNQVIPSTTNLAPEDVENLLQLYADQSTAGIPLPNAGIGYGVADASNTLQHIQSPFYDVLHIPTNVDLNNMTYLGIQNFNVEYDLYISGYNILAGLQPVGVYYFSIPVDATPYIPFGWNVIHSWGTSSMSDYYPDFTNVTYDNSIFLEPHITFTPDINDLRKGTISGYAYQFYDPATNTYPVMPYANGAGVVTFSVHVQNATVGIEDTPYHELIISPNPTNEVLNIETQNGLPIESVKIIDMTGKVIKQINEPTNASKVQINVKNLASGIYAIVLTSRGNIITDKFIKY